MRIAMPEKEEPKGGSGWDVVGRVKAPIQVVAAIVVASTILFGGVAAKAEGEAQVRILYVLAGFLALTLLTTLAALVLWPDRLMRTSASYDQAHRNPDLERFAQQIVGRWWQTVRTEGEVEEEDPVRLSLVTFNPDPATGGVWLDGRSFGADGRQVASWHSEASCAKPDARTVFYYWRGDHGAEAKAGFGEFRFRESEGKTTGADGTFHDTDLGNVSDTVKKTVTLRPCSEAEASLSGDDPAALRKAVLDELARGS